MPRNRLIRALRVEVGGLGVRPWAGVMEVRGIVSTLVDAEIRVGEEICSRAICFLVEPDPSGNLGIEGDFLNAAVAASALRRTSIASNVGSTCPLGSDAVDVDSFGVTAACSLGTVGACSSSTTWSEGISSDIAPSGSSGGDTRTVAGNVKFDGKAAGAWCRSSVPNRASARARCFCEGEGLVAAGSAT